MRRIYKYQLDIVDVQDLFAPKDSHPLHVDDQFGTLTLWMSVDPDSPNEKHRIVVRGTGHSQRSDDGDYVGTALMGSGLVWHVFHRPESTQ